MESCLIVLLLACAVSSPNNSGTFDTGSVLAMKEPSKPEADSANTVRLSTSTSGLQLSVEADRTFARLTRLGWDTEGTGRAGINLLKAPIELRLSKNGQTVTPQVHADTPNPEAIEYGLSLAEDKRLTWTIAVGPHGLRMRVAADGASGNKDISADVDQLELVFPFEPATAVTSIISSNWTDDGQFLIPALINAPDLGQMLVTCEEQPKLTGKVEGHRRDKYVTVTFHLPVPGPGAAINLQFAPVVLPMPEGFKDEKRWKAARRGWFNLIQQSCGASGGGADVAGVWANNVLSDPVSSVLYMLGNATLLVPELAPGVSMPPILRHSPLILVLSCIS